MNISMIITIFVELACIIFCLKKNKNDIFLPSIMAQISLFIGTILAAFYISRWNDTLAENTAVVIAAGFLTLTIVASLSKPVLTKKKSYKLFTYNEKIVKIATFISVICAILYGYNAYKVGLMAGGKGLNAFAYMKESYLNAGELHMNVFIRQGFKVIIAISYVNILIVAKNLLEKKKTKTNKYCLISVICAIVVTIFSGSRTEILRVLSSLIIIFSVLYRDKYGWSFKTNKKTYRNMIKKFSPFIFLLFVMIFATRTMVKTTDEEISKMTSIIDYFLYYFASPIEVLNKKIQMVFSRGGILFATEQSREILSSHVYLSNLNYGGNVGTMLATVLSSGLIGMIIYYFVVYIIFDTIYKTYIYSKDSTFRRDEFLLIFSTFYFVPIMSFYSNCVNIAFNISSLIILSLTLLYMFAVRRISI